MKNFPYLKEAVADGHTFYVTFVKRTNGEVREMRCRVGVKKHLKGGEKKFSDEEKKLLTVFDLDKLAYRSIPLDQIIRVKVNGKTYE